MRALIGHPDTVMLRRLLIIIALALPASLAAQPQATSGTRNDVMLAFENLADIFGSRLVAAFDSIPAGRYVYRPTPPQRTIGYIAHHLVGANYGLCERVGDLTHPRTAKDPFADTVKPHLRKDTLVARLNASLRFPDTPVAPVPH